jgi:hypothetical protein
MTDIEDEMHELGNAIAALQFCFSQLNGRQPTDELQRIVQGGLDTCQQGIAAFRRAHKAVSVRKMIDSSDGLPEQARRHRMRAAEYRAAADQMGDPTARATYRRLAANFDALGRRLERRCG